MKNNKMNVFAGSVTVTENQFTDDFQKYYSAVITINKMDENNQYRLWDKEAVTTVYKTRSKMFSVAWDIMEKKVKSLNK